MRSVYFLRIGYLRTKAQPVNVSCRLHETAIYEYLRMFILVSFVKQEDSVSQVPMQDEVQFRNYRNLKHFTQ